MFIFALERRKGSLFYHDCPENVTYKTDINTMNKKHLLLCYLLLVFGLLSISFTSCSDDDELDPRNVELAEKLQGSWMFEKGIAANGQEIGSNYVTFLENSLLIMAQAKVDLDTLTFIGYKVNDIKYTLKEGQYLYLEGTERTNGFTVTIREDTVPTILILHDGMISNIDLEYSKITETEGEGEESET